MRREFKLDSNDEQYMDVKGYHWETIIEGKKLWLLVSHFPIPPGYNVTEATLAVQFPSLDYLRQGLDMCYFTPALSRADNKPIAQVNVVEQIDGREFQRWSRHRTPQAPWDPGNDSLVTHLLLIENWLVREFERVK